MEWLIWIIVGGVTGYFIYWSTFEIKHYREKEFRCKHCGATLPCDLETLPEYCGPDCYLSFQLERRK